MAVCCPLLPLFSFFFFCCHTNEIISCSILYERQQVKKPSPKLPWTADRQKKRVVEFFHGSLLYHTHRVHIEQYVGQRPKSDWRSQSFTGFSWGLFKSTLIR